MNEDFQFCRDSLIFQQEKDLQKTYNVYCDESCHLEHDKQPIMLLGAIWCPASEVRQHSIAIREMKETRRGKEEFRKEI